MIQQDYPYLSFFEGMLYTQLDRTSLRQFLVHVELPWRHISRKKLDEAMEYHRPQLKLWENLQNKNDTTLDGLLKRMRKAA